MGNETGDLWDDSALIKAFDDAIYKYKVMHIKEEHDSSVEGPKIACSTETSSSAVADESSEAKRHVEADDNINFVSNTTTEMEETGNLQPIIENCNADSYPPKQHIDLSNHQVPEEGHDGPKNTQGAEDYNQLLNKYYELEEQRNKILQQLYQFDNWNYHSSASAAQCGTSTSQGYQPSAAQASNHAADYSYCPFASHCPCCWAPPCTSAVCSLCGACSYCGAGSGETCNATSVRGPIGKSCDLEDGDSIKRAAGAAERALSSLKIKISSDSNVISSGEKDNEETNICQAHSASSETDLTAVLNAWYSAGFYTGKYLFDRKKM